MIKRVILAVTLAVLSIGVGTVSASANAPGNYAQPNTAFQCGRDAVGSGADVKGYVDVHYNHGSNHSDQAYGSYITIQEYNSLHVDSTMYLDTDIRTVESGTWHWVDTSSFSGVGNHGWLFGYTAPRSQAGGYARWALTYYKKVSGTLVATTCHIPSGTNWFALFGAP
jgi:hypothetical protein